MPRAVRPPRVSNIREPVQSSRAISIDSWTVSDRAASKKTRRIMTVVERPTVLIVEMEAVRTALRTIQAEYEIALEIARHHNFVGVDSVAREVRTATHSQADIQFRSFRKVEIELCAADNT